MSQVQRTPVRDEISSHAQRQTINAAAEEAQRLLAEEDYEQAVGVLESAARRTSSEELNVLLADARQRVEEFDRKVEGAIARARRLLESRRIEDAVNFLESQPKSFARKPRFTDALEKARGEQDVIKGVAGACEKARAAFDKGDFAAAFTIMDACKRTYGETPEFKQAAAEMEGKRSAAAKIKLDKAIKDARTLLLSRQYAAALTELQSVALLVSAAPVELQQQFETLKKDATAGAARLQKEADFGKTIVAGSRDSQTMIAGSTESAAAAAPALASAARIRTAPARGATRPAPAPEPSRSPVMAIAIIFVIIAAVAGGYFGYKKLSAPVPATSYIEINAVPWGMVKSVTSANGKATTINQETPLRLGVAPGQYTVVVTGPNGAEQSQQVSVTDDAPGSYTPVFQKIDVDKILQSN